MISKSQQIFNYYTPYRNVFRKLDLQKSLRAVWAHSIFQQFKKRLPNDLINLPIGYRNASNNIDFMRFGLHTWQLEILARETIINSPRLGKKKSLLNWKYLAKVTNQLKEIENKIEELFISRDNVLLETYRIAHRQFPWQQPPDRNTIIRYWKIYQNLDSFFKIFYNLTFRLYYAVGLMLFGHFLNDEKLLYPPNIKADIQLKHLDSFLERTCLDYPQFLAQLKAELQLNENYCYAFNSLRAHPLIKIKNFKKEQIFCPLPTLLFDRITRGIFYDLIKEPGFDNAYGHSFEEYIGDFLRHALKSNLTVIGEQEYGSDRQRKKSVDWILVGEESALFIECKTKRLRVKSKSGLTDTNSLQNDLNKMASAVVQNYKTYLDYKKGEYPHLKYEQKRKIFILVVTLEEWYIFGDVVTEMLQNEIDTLLSEENIDKSIITEAPYTISSADNIELLASVLRENTIKEVFSSLLDNQSRRLWNFKTHLLDKFAKESKTLVNPFNEEYEKFISETIADLSNT